MDLGLSVLKRIFFAGCVVVTPFAYAAQAVNYPWFVGGAVGGGSTTWEGLVPEQSDQNAALNLSTPIQTDEGGFVWGVAAGVEIFKNFQFQMDYTHYPKALITFDKDSLFSIDHEDQTSFSSNTYTWSMQVKFLVPWEASKLRLFSSGGVAWLARRDDLLEQDIVSPTFGLGLNYELSPHTMAELAFSYTAGNGKSELNPAEDFMPFLYAGLFKLYYRMG